MTTYQIQAPHFTAGFSTRNDGVVRTAAPILQWAYGKNVDEVKAYCFVKGWKIEELKPTRDKKECS